MTTNWEEVEVPRGAYISWGTKAGQHVTGRVVDYNLTGGNDFNDQPCPQIAIELTEPSASINKDGERTNFEPGELVQLNAGQVSLKRALRAADPSPGDLVKITLSDLVKTAKGTVKEFSIKIARGAAVSSPSEPAAAQNDSDDPPF
jgi:hypothetical protein